LRLSQKAQKLTELPDRKLLYIMTISVGKKRRPCCVCNCATEKFEDFHRERWIILGDFYAS